MVSSPRNSILKAVNRWYIMGERVDEVTRRFITFLREATKHGELHDYHVIFKMGTVVRMSSAHTETAIKSLIDDGFPAVGDALFDRFSIPGEPYPDDETLEILWVNLWPYKSPQISNLVIAPAADPIRAATMAAECRRVDFTKCEVHVIIEPDISVRPVQSITASTSTHTCKNPFE
jgi:hypothetical protein